MAARQGITFEEAMKLAERTVVLLCKDAPGSEADEWRRALLAERIEPRIRKH
jgi:hypothetical protein